MRETTYEAFWNYVMEYHVDISINNYKDQNKLLLAVELFKTQPSSDCLSMYEFISVYVIQNDKRLLVRTDKNLIRRHNKFKSDYSCFLHAIPSILQIPGISGCLPCMSVYLSSYLQSLSISPSLNSLFLCCGLF